MRIDITIDKEFKKDLSVPWLRGVARQILVAQCAESSSEMGIYITGQERIRELNRIYRHKDHPTDVLSFSFFVREAAADATTHPDFPVQMNGGINLGEVVISLPQAQLQAAEFGHPLKKELGRLLIHGIMHLLGFDHEKDSDAEIMEDRELQILKELEPSLS
ncbi:rRNA maturation RNase YbeY [Dehalogenimonas alkenigignens]|jgi:probable rRNA maturation factor|uniref:rRNA maturation RNase YbeY n=1 Tax=Dehalogenimonas alkenigignens TaxID=1217799 RepID=UPI000D56A75C|nr:rRNA maturation RNase YbeY [Dehalogenimonas alkenigignens]PVV83670.1 rRNA maturation RNase YbeY [Dehalogenimonas alkenigignens]